MFTWLAMAFSSSSSISSWSSLNSERIRMNTFSLAKEKRYFTKSTGNTLFKLSKKCSVANPESDPAGSETFGRIRMRSGTTINVSDPKHRKILNENFRENNNSFFPASFFVGKTYFFEDFFSFSNLENIPNTYGTFPIRKNSHDNGIFCPNPFFKNNVTASASLSCY
jgi:hypothetical protein